ncbi:MAG TPA: alpha/beta hydrolase [Armatimonadota bacterium]|nr:alpha/beta hydrolase [Armatimonadota bacterium]HOS43888.1 alpha/beta hydrolase [Armatimonadota bacterium]
MIRAALRRWRRTLTGFPGLGGIGWLSSVMLRRGPEIYEDLAPEEIAGPETRYLRVNGEAVSYRETGAGDPPVVLIHGFGGRIETWRDVQPVLAERHRTVAFDLWGFGAAGRPRALTPRDWVAETFGVMDALGIASAYFVTHSLGGRVALMCARQAPERVRGLVLCDVDWGQAPHGYLLARGICHTPLFDATMLRLRGERRHLHRLMTMVLGRQAMLTPELIELYHGPLRVRGTAHTLGCVGRSDHLRGIRALTRGIACPSLVIWGQDDPVIPAGYGDLLARKLGADGPHLVPACGHFPQEEYPEVVNPLIESWLARQAPRPDAVTR